MAAKPPTTPPAIAPFDMDEDEDEVDVFDAESCPPVPLAVVELVVQFAVSVGWLY